MRAQREGLLKNKLSNFHVLALPIADKHPRADLLAKSNDNFGKLK
jgi:hypothetical protein